MFGVDSIYHPLLWFFLIGLMLPVPFFVLHKMFPNSPIKFHLINVPIIAMGASIVPQSPANFIISSFIISFIFQFYIYRYSRDWWNKYVSLYCSLFYCFMRSYCISKELCTVCSSRCWCRCLVDAGLLGNICPFAGS